MYNEKEESLNKLLGKIAECENLLADVEKLNDEIKDLRRFTSVGTLVPFRGKKLHDDVLSSAMYDLKKLIEMKEYADDLLEKGFEEKEYKIGDIVVANEDIRARARNSRNKEFDVSGYHEYSKNVEFVILDINGVNYILHAIRGNDEQLLFITKEQLDIFFDKVDSELNENWFKIEFTLNGPDMKFAENLNEIRLYQSSAWERERNDWDFAANHTHVTSIIDLTADEVFGMMGTAYFHGRLRPNYEDIMFKFGTKFATGFSQHKDQKEMYKYNGKISFFTKEKGRHGDTYFPKDVFTGMQRERIANIVETKELISFKEPVYQQNEARG